MIYSNSHLLKFISNLKETIRTNYKQTFDCQQEQDCLMSSSWTEESEYGICTIKHLSTNENRLKQFSFNQQDSQTIVPLRN